MHVEHLTCRFAPTDHESAWICDTCGRWWYDRHVRGRPPIRQCRSVGELVKPLSLRDRILARQKDLQGTRPIEEIKRHLETCLTDCSEFGTLYLGNGQYYRDGCPRFGRPCRGAFETWMRALADATCHCNRWNDVL